VSAPTATVDRLLERPPTNQIGSLARHGALWTFGLIVGRYVVSIAATAVLARILTATDYGLMGMVMTLTAFFYVFSDMGLSWATVQKRDLTRGRVDNLFWINAAAGATLWGACVLVGPLLNQFYARPELARVAVVLGAGFLLSSLTVQPLALLQRQIRLRAVSVIQMTAQAGGAAVGVSMALSGFGYWALVGQSLSVQAILLLLLFGHTGYRPGSPKAGQGTMKMVTFGGYLAAYGIVTYFARNLDNVLIGRVWGAEQLGYYSRAYFLMTLPMTLAAGSLVSVMVPSLSTLNHDRERMAQAYRKAVSAIGSLGFPLVAGLAVTAPEAVRLVYGPKWAPVVPIFLWLCIAGLSQPVYVTGMWLLLACGRTRELFLCGLAVMIVLASGFAVGVKSGAIGVAVAYAITMGLVLPLPALYFAHRVTGISFSLTMRAAAPYFLAAVTMGVFVAACGHGLTALGADWRVSLVVKVTVGVALYLGLCWRRLSPQLDIFFRRDCGRIEQWPRKLLSL
jgi:O-antigen/teichoic acid export membrane protein